MKYPTLVTKLTAICEAWIIGSGACKENPRDYDLYIPVVNWREACAMMPPDAKLNSFGGFKVISDGIEIDIWTGDMSYIFQTNAFSEAYHPKSGVRISRIRV